MHINTQAHTYMQYKYINYKSATCSPVQMFTHILCVRPKNTQACLVRPKKIALFPEDRVAKKSLTRAAAKKIFLHTNGNPNEKRK